MLQAFGLGPLKKMMTAAVNFLCCGSSKKAEFIYAQRSMDTDIAGKEPHAQS